MMHTGFFSSGSINSNWLCGPGAFFPGPLGWIITLLFWGLIIYLAIRIFQALIRGSGRNTEPSLEILASRYARGEIDEEQYRRMKAELG
ncbi:SHOCT domain-containing protein [Desulfolithobacter sp.]